MSASVSEELFARYAHRVLDEVPLDTPEGRRRGVVRVEFSRADGLGGRHGARFSHDASPRRVSGELPSLGTLHWCSGQRRYEAVGDVLRRLARTEEGTLVVSNAEHSRVALALASVPALRDLAESGRSSIGSVLREHGVSPTVSRSVTDALRLQEVGRAAADRTLLLVEDLLSGVPLPWAARHLAAATS